MKNQPNASNNSKVFKNKKRKEKKKGYISAQSINPNRLIAKNF